MKNKLRVGDKIFSKYFVSLIQIVKINSDNDWYFKYNGVIHKARTPLSYFEKKL